MTHSRRPKKDLEAYRLVLEAAHVGEGPQPLCQDRPEEFVDYGYPLPAPAAVEKLCSACPLKTGRGNPGEPGYVPEDICLTNAKHRGPQWGIYGGVLFIQGRQAALMREDDERLRDPDLINVAEIAG